MYKPRRGFTLVELLAVIVILAVILVIAVPQIMNVITWLNDNNGFIIRNSWGSSFGSEGYTKIPNEDLGKFIELWSIIN